MKLKAADAAISRYFNLINKVYKSDCKKVDLYQFSESFNGKFRAACLNQHWFRSLNEAQEEVEAWRHND